MADDPDWALYRTFAAVAHAGSFTAAARSLGSTQPTVGRQIEALEALLGTGLFVRSTRGLTPTPAAERLLPYAEAMAAAAATLRRTSSGEARGEFGTVRLTAGEFTGAEVLPPILAEFCAAHPGIEIELSLSNRNEDLLRREADIAVRGNRPTQQSLVAKRIGVAEVALFAHRRYAMRAGLPQTVAALREHRVIGFDRDFSVIETSSRALGQKLTREDFSFRTDSTAAQLAALRAGLGITACQVIVARRDPELVPVLPAIRYKRELWLAMHDSARTTRRIRLLFDHLAAGLAAYLREGRARG